MRIPRQLPQRWLAGLSDNALVALGGLRRRSRKIRRELVRREVARLEAYVRSRQSEASPRASPYQVWCAWECGGLRARATSDGTPQWLQRRREAMDVSADGVVRWRDWYAPVTVPPDQQELTCEICGHTLTVRDDRALVYAPRPVVERNPSVWAWAATAVDQRLRDLPRHVAEELWRITAPKVDVDANRDSVADFLGEVDRWLAQEVQEVPDDAP